MVSVLGDGSGGRSDCLGISFCWLWLISWTMWRGIADNFLLDCLRLSRRQIFPVLTSDARRSGLVAVLLGVAWRD